MKICTACQKTFNDDMNFCSACGHTLAAAAAANPVESAAPAPDANAVSAAKPASDFRGILYRFWPLLAAILGYVISWAPDGDLCLYGTIIAVGSAVAGWLEYDGKILCKSIPVRVLATIVGAIALVEYLIYAA